MPKYQTRPLEKISQIILHCSATPSTMDIGAKEIRQWHLSQGWIDIGYHYVIRRDGTLEIGRPLEAVGAHCSGQNKDSIGICLVGGGLNGEDKYFTDAQFETAANLIRELQEKLGWMQIFGHNHYANKACPVFDVSEFINKYKL